MNRWVPDAVWIERGEEHSPIARRVIAALGGVPVTVIDDPRATGPGGPERFTAGKRRLLLQRHRGRFLHHCPAGTPGLVCCNYLVVSLVSNCPFDCSYCFLQDYLANNPVVKAFTNPGDALDQIDRVLHAHPERSFRIGTGELADSLALDPITGLTSELVPFFAERRNATLELKTKSDCVDNLLAVDPKDRVVVSWSVNTPMIIEADEAGTATLTERLEAARRVQAGYRLGFHFDPLIEHPGWEEGYRDTVARMAAMVDPRRVAWISLGSLRLSPGLRAAIRSRPAPSMVLSGEFVPCRDGKARIWRGLRMRMYRRIQEYLRGAFPQAPIYLCMETPGVWENLRGEAPTDRQVALRLAEGAAW